MASPEEKAVKWTLLAAFLLIASLSVVLVRRSLPSEEEQQQEQQDQTLIATVEQTAPTMGTADTPQVVLVEFTDLQCPSCKAVEPLLDQAVTQYKTLRRVWVHTINRAEHPESENAAVASQCAHQQGKFWEYTKQLFNNQGDLSTLLYNRTAQNLGLNIPAFQTCLSSTEVRDIVRAHDQFARRSDVTATPYVLVNGIVLTGEFSYEDLKRAIDQELSRAAQQP